MQHVTDEFVKVRDFISTLVPPAPSRNTPPTAQVAKEPTILATSVYDGNGGDTDPVPKCADPQVHGRGFSSLPVDHDKDMDNEMQERNGVCLKFRIIFDFVHRSHLIRKCVYCKP
ncbi:Hypothetical predicted protein [Olea europaea subsp. europaea]|uniref:Uncharacterized protein n=1 Tax=Olea europaea subsp. europaea TaxID=158383 RepID=A0A8S0RGA4_OLEEU|nr:Hypothetical predicted protein [Olea europaea subsp. europaea]